MPDRLARLVVGLAGHRAGVDDDHVRARFVSKRCAAPQQLGRDRLGLDLVDLAAERPERDRRALRPRTPVHAPELGQGERDRHTRLSRCAARWGRAMPRPRRAPPGCRPPRHSARLPGRRPVRPSRSRARAVPTSTRRVSARGAPPRARRRASCAVSSGRAAMRSTGSTPRAPTCASTARPPTWRSDASARPWPRASRRRGGRRSARS